MHIFLTTFEREVLVETSRVPSGLNTEEYFLS
jgi:hypothetical protein